MKKLFTLFLFALLAITSAWAADELYYTLQCAYNKSYNAYATYNDVTISGMTWNAPGNQTQGDFWRIGGKSLNGVDRTITGKSQMGEAISKVTVSHNGFNDTGITLNSVKLTVSSDANFTEKNIIEEVTITSPKVSKGTAGTFDFAPSAGKTWTSGAYYKISFNISVSVKDNRGIDITKIEFFKSATSTTPGKTATSLSFGADWDGKEITKYIGEGIFNRPATLTPAVEGATITYSSSDKNVAIIDENGDILLGNAVGKTTIKASYAGDETHEASSASFTIDLQKLPDPTISPAQGAVVAGTVVTIKAPIDGATIEVSYEPEGEATEVVKDVAETTITISKPTYIIAQTVYNGVKSDGVEATYTIKTLDAIEITGNPIKTTYAPGEAFDLTGLKVTPKYSDGSTSPAISGATMTFSPETFASGDNSVTVTATYGELTATKDFDVTVAEASTNTFTLVTSKDQLSVGDQVIFSNTGHSNLMGVQNTNNRRSETTGITWNGDHSSVTVSNDNVAIATLEAGTKEGTFAFKVKDGDKDVYLYAASSSDNYLKSKASIDDNASAKISISSNAATITFQGDNTRNILRYNSSSKLFSCYSSGQQAVLIYKAGTVVVKPDAPTFDPASGAAFDTETATVTITAQEGCTLKYTVGSGEVQTSDSNTAKVTVSPTAYTITAKSVDAEGVESNEATASYTFNVVAHVKNIAEFMALEPNATAIFDNPVVVLYDYSQPATSGTKCEYIWVKDESGQTNLYLPVAFDVTNHVAHYENGDVIPAGFKATKNLYDKGNFYQALVDATNKATLKDATLKRLADPVTITFSQFAALTDADLAEWNNTYVMIPRVKFTQKSRLEYNVIQDGTTSKWVFYNKYSDVGAKKKDGSTAVVSMPEDKNVEYYNVYGILQVYSGVWEIMPIRFVEYSAQTVTLKELVELGNANSTDVNTEYTILNDLRGVRALSGNVILAKDENGNAVDKVTPAGNSFMINAKSKFDDAATEESVNAKAQEDYDQSNWVEIVLPEGVSAANYVDHIITGMTVKGNYTDTKNPRLVATATPTAGGETGAYTRNAMCPANFMGTSQKCNDKVQNHGDFFFMTPKPNECVQVVWAVYNSTVDAFYIPKSEGSINSHGFVGAFSIDWTYNAGGKKTLENEGLYQFAAVVKKTVVKKEPEAQSSTKRKVAYDNTQDLSKDYVVYPLNLDANTVTGITETTGAKTVKSVRYFNIMGVELAEPTAGVNIVLTTYTDGTTHSQKILK